ncbi:hypothetical protein ACFL2Y_05170 [Candidatus Omnitrophota bacterium]
MNRLFNYYRNRISSKLGQATTEIAVMGTILLVVFGVLLRYAQMMNAQQEIKMYTHRRALELAKSRRDHGRHGTVSLTAMREVFPVNIFSSEREPTYVSASSSISMHEKTGYFQDGEIHRTQPEHVGASYYQIGADMINNDKAIVMPMMLVNRRIDESKGPVTPWDADVKWMRNVISYGQGDDPPTEYDVLEPAPIEDVDQFIQTVSSSQYSSSETPADASYRETNELNVTQISTYKFMDKGKIKRWSDDGTGEQINDVKEMPAEDIVIETTNIVNLDRAWDTPK